MRLNRRSVVAATLVFALMAGACSGDDDDSPDETDPEEPADEPADEPATDGDDDDADDDLDGEGLSLGFIRAQVGLFGILGSAQAGALSLAVDDVAEGGGVLGGPLTIAEDQPTPDRDVTAVFSDLVDAGNNLIVGPATSEEALMLIPLLADANALACGASTTAPGLPALPEAEGRFLRTTFDDNIVAVNAFDRIRQQTGTILDRAPKVTIVARGDAYGDSVSGALAPMLALVGMEITVERYEAEDQLLESVATATAASEPDVVVVISLAEGPRLARQIVDAGVPADRVLGLDGLASPRFTGKANITDPANYQNLTVVGATGPLAFLARVLDKPESNEEVLYAAQAYDCAISFALAVEAAGSTDPGDVATALREVTGGGTVCTTYADCAALIRDGEDVDYEGPSGPVDFTEEGEPGGGRILTARLTGDQLRVVADLKITLDEIRSRVAPKIAGFIGDIQVALTQLGYYTGPIDGQQNEEFVAAVMAFQTDNGLEPTGELDAETIAAIQAALAERGLLLSASISEIQQILTDLGYYTGPIDGIWSQALSDAIAAFQTTLGVEPTGILDAATLRAIYQAGFISGGGGTTTTTVPPTTPPTTPPATTTPPPDTTTPPATTVPETTVPAEVSMFEVIEGDPALTELVALLQRPEPEIAAIRTVLEDPATVGTFFAPIDGSWPDDILTADAAEVAALLQYHMLEVAENPLTPGLKDTLLEEGGTAVQFEVADPPESITDASEQVVQLRSPITPLPSSAGVVYAINAVLNPTAP